MSTPKTTYLAAGPYLKPNVSWVTVAKLCCGGSLRAHTDKQRDCSFTTTMQNCFLSDILLKSTHRGSVMLCRYGSFGLPQPPTSYVGPLSNCTDFTGPLPELAQNLVYNFNNSGQTFRSMRCIRMSVCLLYGRTCLQQMTSSWECTAATGSCSWNLTSLYLSAVCML